MKRLFVLLLTALLLLGMLSACGKQPQPAETEMPAAHHAADAKEEPTPTEEPVLTEEPAPTEEPALTEEPAPTEEPIDLGENVPLMWRVTDGESHELYLFGTIHVGDARNEAVLGRVAPVLERCGALAVEFDTVAYTEDTQQAMNDMMQYVLTDGSVVSDYMPEELYQRSYELLQKAGLFPSLFKNYNVAMWNQLVDSAMIMVYSSLDPDCGMDNLLIHHAYDRDIPVLDVESAQFQMNLLNSFDNELYLILIQEALDSAESYDSQLIEMYELWLSGDREAFWALLAGEEAEEEDSGDYTEEQIALIEDYNRKLLDDRNLGMRDRALEYLASGDTVFFAVGAAHMANDMGLVQLLTDAGCTVEPFEY